MVSGIPAYVTFREQIGPVELSLAGIGHRYGRNILFRDVTATLSGGSSVAVVGSNGSGKSTLMKIAAGLLTPWRGSVSLTIDRVDVAREQHPFAVGMVAPYLQVYDGFSPRENLVFLMRARGVETDVSRRADELIELVGLSGRGDDLVSTFSSGMQQRVRVAAALVADPPVLLFDEPSTNLDAAGREMVDFVGERHVSRGGLLVVATNDAEEAERHALRLDVERFAR